MMRSLEEAVLKMVEEKNYADAQAELSEWNEADIAALLEEVPMTEALELFRLLPKTMAADVFSFLPLYRQRVMIESLTDQETVHIIENMFSNDAADLLDEMPSNVVRRILAAASHQTRTQLNALLQYPDDSAGTIMLVEYVSLKENWTVEQAMKRIRSIGNKSKTANICYVLNDDRKLVGIVSLRELVFHDHNEYLKDIMEDRPIVLHPSDDQEYVAQMFNKYDFNAMPVVDSENCLLGIITVDDIIEMIEQETTKDMTRMAAVTPDIKRYTDTTVGDEIRRRIPWLLLLMLSATFTGAIITFYEGKLVQSIALAAFMPMLMDTGGNAGGQSSTMVIRALSLNEIAFKDFFRVVWKEFRVAFCCGFILAGANFVKMMLFDRVGVMVAAVVCCTLVVTVIFSKLIGTVLPIIAERIGLDAAVMANPIITTIVDAVSLLVYFRFAVLMLGI